MLERHGYLKRVKMPHIRSHLEPIIRTDSADLRGDYVRLDRNERVTPVEAHLLDGIISSLTWETFALYPDPLSLELKIAEKENLSATQVSVTNGSDAAIRKVFEAFVSPGDCVIFPSPTYQMYEVYGKLYQAKVETIDYCTDRTLDISDLKQKISTHKPKLFCLVNPDQPTGTIQSLETLKELASCCNEQGTVFLVDEAYYNCKTDSAAKLLTTFDNVVVTRSFSKMYGFGGIRLGYVLSSASLINGLKKVKGLHEVNNVALAVGNYLLDHPSETQKYISSLEEGREKIRIFAEKYHYLFPLCLGNFQLVELPEDISTKVVVDELKKKGFLIKGNFAHPSVKGMLRISLADAEIIGRLIQALEQTIKQVGK